jgi:hypothetical protein
MESHKSEIDILHYIKFWSRLAGHFCRDPNPFATFAKQEAARISERTKAGLRVAKAGGKTIAYSTHFVLRCVLLWTSSRNDSGMPDTAKKPAVKKTPAARKPAAKAPTPTGTASVVTKAMLAKIGRAYKKADMPDVSEQEKLEFAQELLAAGVPILNRSSARISRAIKGEISIEDLKVSRRATA